MRKLLIAAVAVASTAAVPASAGAAPDVPGTCDLIKNTMCNVPDHVPTGCELQEWLGVQNVRACEDTYPA